MISSFSSSSSPLPQLGERLDQPHEVLVRLDVADVQHEPVIELVALAHARDLAPRAASIAEPLVDGVVDDDDLLRRHVEEVQDVALRRLGHRQDAIAIVCAAAHIDAARVRIAPRGSAGTAETSGGCSRGSSRPSGTRTAGGST